MQALIHVSSSCHQFFFSSPSFTGRVGDFLERAAVEFSFFDLEAEQPLKHYELYEMYQSLVESSVEAFLQSEGVSSEHIFEELRKCQEDG